MALPPIKGLDIPGTALNPPSSASGGPTTMSRGLEPHHQRFENPMEPSRKGAGPRPFMSHSGPVADHPDAMSRGQFSARSLLKSY